MKTIKYLTIVLFIFTSLHANGQKDALKNLDYYFKILDTASGKEIKLKTLKDMQPLTHVKGLDVKIFERLVKEAIAIEEYDLAGIYAINSNRAINQTKPQKERVMIMYDSLEKYKDQFKKPVIFPMFYLNRGLYNISISKYEKAIEALTFASENFDKIDDQQNKVISIYTRGDAHYTLGNLFEALNDASFVVKNFGNFNEDKDHLRAKSFYYFSAARRIANIYTELGMYDKAYIEHQKIIEKKIKINDLTDLGFNYSHLGGAYNRDKEYEKATESYLLSVKYAKLQSERKGAIFVITDAANQNLLFSYSFLTKLFAGKKDLRKAKKYLDSTEIYYKKINPTIRHHLSYNNAKTNYFIEKGEYEKALNLTKKSLKLARNKSRMNSIKDLEAKLSLIYLKKKDSANAYKHLTAYLIIKDSVASVEKSKSLIYYQTLYETEKNEKEILTQQKDIEILDSKNKAKQRYLIFGGLGLLFVFGIILLYRNRKQLQKEKKVQEVYSENLLATQESERERISKDLHDGLGQSLLIIKNKVALQKDPDTKDLVNNAIEEMRTISRILYPSQLEDAGITIALKNLISQLDENYKDTYIFGDIEDFDKALPIEKEVNVFRIVQECLSNIIKHAKAKSAKVIVVHKNEEITIEIKDNGIGFDFSEKYNDFKSLGLKTIKKRVAFLNGFLKIESNKNEGTRFLIKLPTK
jgi:signal transduction histidine kinase